MATKNTKVEEKVIDVETVEETPTIVADDPIPAKGSKAKTWFKRNWKKVAGGAAIAASVAGIAAVGMRSRHNSEPELTDEEALEKLKDVVKSISDHSDLDVVVDDLTLAEPKDPAE